MREIIRWPGAGAIAIDNFTAKPLYSNVEYVSWSNPAYWTNQIVNIIFIPSQAAKILRIRMLINTRTGTTSNACDFNFCIIDVNTGIVINQLPTTPAVLDPTNPVLFPLWTWQTVYQAAPVSSAPIVNTGEYFGIVFTGPAGSQSSSNDLRVTPLVEVLVDN